MNVQSLGRGNLTDNYFLLYNLKFRSELHAFNFVSEIIRFLYLFWWRGQVESYEG